MAQIQYYKGGGTITWDENDWAAGLAQGVGVGGIPLLKSNLGSRTLSGIDPYRNHGFIQPGSFPEEATNSNILAGQLMSGVITSNYTTIYGIDAGGKVHSYNHSTNTLLNSGGVFPRTIAGTSPKGQDILIYKHNSSSVPVFSTFYSYYNSANWDVGAYVNQTTFDDDFMSSVPATPLDITTGDGDDAAQRTAPHTMVIGADDILYIGSGRYLHAYDGATGANGTFSARVLTMPQGFQVVGMVKYNDLMLVAGNYFPATSGSSDGSGESFVYVWDYLATDVSQVIPLKDPTVSNIFIWRGEPHVITYGSLESKGQIHLKRIVGNIAIKITDFNQGTVPVFRGVDSSNQTLYVNCGGVITTVGNVLTDNGYEVNNITYLTATNGSGWFKTIPGANLVYIASSSDGSTSYKLSKFTARATLGYSTGTYRSGYVEPTFPIGYMGKVRSVIVSYRNTVTTESTKNFIITLDTDFNQGSTNVVSATGLAAPLIKRYFVGDASVVLPTFSNISLKLLWQNGAAAWLDFISVSKVTIDYEDMGISPNS